MAQCGPSTYVAYSCSYSPKLSVYDTGLKCLRDARCKIFSEICSNSKFVFGVWQRNERQRNERSDANERELYSHKMIQVHDLGTLSEAFGLRLPIEYTVERIMADEHHLVTMNRLENDWSGHQWSMSIFNVATFNESDGDKSDSRGGKTARFFVAERHIELSIKSLVLSSVFPFNGWLVVHREKEKELVWFNKNGKRSETRTRLDSISNLRAIYSTVSSLLFTTVSKH